MTDKTKLSDLIVIELELHDCEILANAINVFGSGEHPMAQADSLDYFDLDYMLDCLDKGIQKTSTEEFKEECIDLWASIHMAKSEVEDASPDEPFFDDPNYASPTIDEDKEYNEAERDSDYHLGNKNFIA